MRAFFCLLLALAAALEPAGATDAAVLRIPEAETLLPPTAARLTQLETTAERAGWGSLTAPLHAAALHAYQAGRLDAASGWYLVGRWAWLFNETEAHFAGRWRQAVAAAATATRPEPALVNLSPRPIAAAIQPELRSWLLASTAFSEQFFAQLSPLDHVPSALRILGTLRFRDPARFATYANLALAFALVADVPPPPGWPHRQVPAAALPRHLVAPDAAFAWWTRQDELGRTAHPLARLSAAELRFLVDTPAPLPELEWAANLVDLPLKRFAQAYSMVAYDQDRARRNDAIWSQRTYRLPDILGHGGICVDQAYFAATAGKARGIPTVIFHGAGTDSRHAWFGYLETPSSWRLDAGRDGEQRFVAGHAADPQTWCELSAPDLIFLAERFHAGPEFRPARIHADFAAGFLATGDAPAALAAARRALAIEAQYPRAWDIAAAASENRGAAAVEVVLREAQHALRRHPPLAARYGERLAASLRTRGDIAAAETEENKLVSGPRRQRTELALQRAREVLRQAVATGNVAAQASAFRTAIDSVRREPAVAVFDLLVAPFAGHLFSLGERAEAQRALDHARGRLAIEAGSRLHREFERLGPLLQESKSP